MTPEMAAWLTMIASVAELSACAAWVFIFSPASDKLRLESHYSAPGRKIIHVKRKGTAPGNRTSPWYRIYEVIVEDFNRIGHYSTGVQVTVFSEPRLKQFARPRWSDLAG